MSCLAIITTENPFLESDSKAETIPNEQINIKEKENERKQSQAKLGKKQGITIATWNTRGKNDEQKKSKWKQIKRIMPLKRIAILAVQESQVTEEEAKKIEKENPGIKILNNGEYTNKLGTLFTINQRIIDNEKEGTITHQIIIPNRVVQLKLKWGKNQILNMINIYAPNDPKEREDFFKDSTKKLKQKGKEAFCLLGDFNCITEDIDQSPVHRDNENVTEALNKLLLQNKLIDTWRAQHPQEKEYMFIQKGTESRARIDRIYLHENLHKVAYDTKIESNFELSDHALLTTKIIKDNLPYCREGMWKLPDKMTENKEFQTKAKKNIEDYEDWYEEYENVERNLGTESPKLKDL